MEKDNDVNITMAYLPDWEKFLTVEFEIENELRL